MQGRDMAMFLVQSGLEKKTVAFLLEMADIDKDGRFDRDEQVKSRHRRNSVPSRHPRRNLLYKFPTHEMLMTRNAQALTIT